MLNVEKYMEDIKNAINEDGFFAYVEETDKIATCVGTDCKHCYFCSQDGECYNRLMVWLWRESQEITDKEYNFCLSMNENYYLYKSLSDGTVSLYTKYPSLIMNETIPDLGVLGLNFNCIKQGQIVKIADIIEKYKKAVL